MMLQIALSCVMDHLALVDLGMLFPDKGGVCSN